MCWTVKSRAVHRQQTVSEYRLTIVHYSVGRSDLKQYAGYCCGLNDMSSCGCVDCSRRHCNSRCALLLPLWVYSSWGVFKCCSFVSFPNPYSCLLSTQDVSPYWPFVVVVVVVMPRPWHCQCIYYYFSNRHSCITAHLSRQLLEAGLICIVICRCHHCSGTRME